MPVASPRSIRRRRLCLATLAALTIAAGLLVHRFGSGILGDITGDALYAVMVYLIVACLLARSARTLPAAIAIILCSCVELLQLTDLPHAWAAVFPPVVLMLGAGFELRDLIVYAVAALGAMFLDVAISRVFAACVQPA